MTLSVLFFPCCFAVILDGSIMLRSLMDSLLSISAMLLKEKFTLLDNILRCDTETFCQPVTVDSICLHVINQQQGNVTGPSEPFTVYTSPFRIFLKS